MPPLPAPPDHCMGPQLWASQGHDCLLCTLCLRVRARACASGTTSGNPTVCQLPGWVSGFCSGFWAVWGLCVCCSTCGDQAGGTGYNRLQPGSHLARALQGVVVAEGAQGHGAPVMACQRKQHLHRPIRSIGPDFTAEQQCLRRARPAWLLDREYVALSSWVSAQWFSTVDKDTSKTATHAGSARDEGPQSDASLTCQ